jgi:hypothetical protein
MPVAYIINVEGRSKAYSTIIHVKNRVIIEEKGISQDPEGRCLAQSLRHNLEVAFEILSCHVA